MTRRALGALVLPLVLACGSREAKTGPPPPSPLHLVPLAELVPSAGLTWLVVAEPRAIAGNASLIPAVAEVLPEERMLAFARRTGGIDPRAMEELVVATYGESTLLLVREPLDPGRVEAAFTEHALHVEGRAADRQDDDPRGVITRLSGSDALGHVELAILGREAAGYESGRSTHLRAAELFALGKIHRASPALRSEPLARAATLLGDAPVRAFAAGPFTGDWKRGLGGLLGASTAAAMAMRVEDGTAGHAGAGDAPRLAFAFALLGGWGDHAAEASERLAVEFDLVAQSSLGRLLGFDHPLHGPEVRATAEALTVEVAVDAVTFARGLHAATGARVDEIMAP